ncbi:MAG: hypothetical protein ACK2U6_21350, partial [Candidatus Promineifilaceae bacterium]
FFYQTTPDNRFPKKNDYRELRARAAAGKLSCRNADPLITGMIYFPAEALHERGDFFSWI